MDIVFVTHNKGKVESAKKAFNKINFELFDYDIDEPDVNDITYIAEYKVKRGYELTSKPCISLDSGFYIEEFPGKKNFPGAYVRRELVDKLGIDGLLDKMRNVKNRKCYFKECLAYYDGTNIKFFYGLSEGFLSNSRSGLDTEKKWSDLWYVFIPKNESKTLAMMTDEERDNRHDDHTSAFQEFIKWYQG